MRYVHVKTGAIIETECKIKGDNWMKEKDYKALKKKNDAVSEESEKPEKKGDDEE